MERNEQLETIRAACIKANPDKLFEYDTYPTDRSRPVWHEEPVRLADVLLTIGGADIMVNTGGQWIKYIGESERGLSFIVEAASQMAVSTAWNLRQDDLALQSDECITFLTELLK